MPTFHDSLFGAPLRQWSGLAFVSRREFAIAPMLSLLASGYRKKAKIFVIAGSCWRLLGGKTSHGLNTAQGIQTDRL